MGILGSVKAASALAKANPAGVALSVLRVVWPYLLALAVLGVIAWKLWHAGYDEAVKDEAKARGELTAQRDEAVRQRNATVAANGTLAASEQAMRDALAVATAENVRLGTQREAALDEAEQAREQSATTLAAWQRAGGSRQPTCVAAQSALVKACPAVKDF